MKLKTKHILEFSRIIKQASLKEEVSEALNNTASAQDIGIEFVFAVIEKCADKGVQESLYCFWGNVTGIPTEEIPELDVDELVGQLEELKEDNPRFLSILQNLMQ